MSRTSRIVLLFGALCIASGAANVAEAGWVTEWEHTPIKANGERGTSQPTTMSIEKGRVRLVQPTTTSLIDYNKSRFTILNSEREYFWSGSVDQYVEEMLKVRARAAKEKRGKDTEIAKPEKIDPKSLPPVVVTKTEETEKIAGYNTQKYEVRVNGELFEELWIAEDLDLSSDMSPEKVLAYQKKMSAAMLGNSATSYNALYYSPEYKKLLEKGFALRSITHHIAGGYERTAVNLKQAEIPDSAFEVPDSYRKVRLVDVFSTGESS